MKKKPSSSQETQSTPQKYNLNLHWSHPINKPFVREARDLFLKEYNFERIYLVTGLPPSIFVARAKAWNKIREKFDDKIITDIRKKAVSAQTKEFVEKGLQVGLKFINRLLKRESEISPKDFKLVSDAISNLHRIHQLELGKPTDISMYENMSPQQTVEYIKEVQRQLTSDHDMSMFAPRDDVPEEELLAEYAKSKDGNHIQ